MEFEISTRETDRGEVPLTLFDDGSKVCATKVEGIEIEDKVSITKVTEEEIIEAERVQEDEQFVVVEEVVVKERLTDGFLSGDLLVQEEETEKIYESTSVASIDEEAKVRMTELIEMEKPEMEDTIIPEITTMKMDADKLDTDIKVAEIEVFAPEEKQLTIQIKKEQEIIEFVESGQGEEPIEELGLSKMTDAEHDHLATEVAEVPVTTEKDVVTIQTLESPTKEIVTSLEALSQASADEGTAQKEGEYEVGVRYPEIEQTYAVTSTGPEISPELICEGRIEGEDSVVEVLEKERKSMGKDVCEIRESEPDEIHLFGRVEVDQPSMSEHKETELEISKFDKMKDVKMEAGNIVTIPSDRITEFHEEVVPHLVTAESPMVKQPELIGIERDEGDYEEFDAKIQITEPESTSSVVKIESDTSDAVEILSVEEELLSSKHPSEDDILKTFSGEEKTVVLMEEMPMKFEPVKAIVSDIREVVDLPIKAESEEYIIEEYGSTIEDEVDAIVSREESVKESKPAGFDGEEEVVTEIDEILTEGGVVVRRGLEDKMEFEISTRETDRAEVPLTLFDDGCKVCATKIDGIEIEDKLSKTKVIDVEIIEAEEVHEDEQFVVVEEGVAEERPTDAFLSGDQLVQEEETEKNYESTSVASIDEEEFLSRPGEKPRDECRISTMTDSEYDLITTVALTSVAIETGMVTIQALESPTKEDVTDAEAVSQESTDGGIAQKYEHYGVGVIYPEIKQTYADKSTGTEIPSGLVCDGMLEGEVSVEVVEKERKGTGEDVCEIRRSEIDEIEILGTVGVDQHSMFEHKETAVDVSKSVEMRFLSEPKIISKEIIESTVDHFVVGVDELDATVNTTESPSVPCDGGSDSVILYPLPGHSSGQMQPFRTETADDYIVHESWLAGVVTEEQEFFVEPISKCLESDLDILIREVPALELASTISDTRKFSSQEGSVGRFVSRDDLVDKFETEIDDARITDHGVSGVGRCVLERTTAEEEIAIAQKHPETIIGGIFLEDASQTLLLKERDDYGQKEAGFEIKDSLLQLDTSVKEGIAARSVRIDRTGDDVIDTRKGNGVVGKTLADDDIMELRTVRYATVVESAVAEVDRGRNLVVGKFLTEEKGLSKAERTEPEVQWSELAAADTPERGGDKAKDIVCQKRIQFPLTSLHSTKADEPFVVEEPSSMTEHKEFYTEGTDSLAVEEVFAVKSSVESPVKWDVSVDPVRDIPAVEGKEFSMTTKPKEEGYIGGQVFEEALFVKSETIFSPSDESQVENVSGVQTAIVKLVTKEEERPRKESDTKVEIKKCDLEEVCEAGVIGLITQGTEDEIKRTEGKATKLLLVGQESCDLEALASVKDVSAVLSQQDLTGKSKVEKEVVETTECAYAEAYIGLSASFESKSDSSPLTTGYHVVRLPCDSQSVTDHLSVSYLVRESPHDFVHCRIQDEAEMSSKPEMRKTIVGLESHFVEETCRDDFDYAKFDDSVNETASSKFESRIFDDTQTTLLPSDAVLPFLSSSSIPQFSKMCDTSDGKGRVARKSRQQRLVIDTNVAETEVKELICEVREVTRQIKQEVRELKPDLTPTPEGKESSILPISESREFVELTDLGCIKEEQIVVDLGDEIIKHPVPFCAIDASSGTASSAALSGTERGGSGSCPSSRDYLLRAKVIRPTVDTEDSDALSGSINTGPIRWVSQEVQQALSAPVCRLTGRDINNVLDAPDTTVGTPARGMPGQDREGDFMPDNSIIEELVRTVSDTFTELSELTSGETPVEKEEILDKSSGSLMKNVPQSDVLDSVAPSLPVGIFEASVSAEVSDKISGPLYEIERGCLRGDDVSATMPDVEKHFTEESVSHGTEIISRYEEGLFVQESGPSEVVAEAEYVVIESIAERGLQETEQMSQDREPSVAVEGKYISHAPFEDRRRLLEMGPSAAVETVTPIIPEVILEDGVPVSEKFESSVDIVPADFIEASHPASRLQFGASSQQEQSLYRTREKAEIPTETSNWKMSSNSGFQVSQDDIVMEDDLLAVTITTEKTSNFASEGKLFTTESGTTYFEFETGTTRSICVCEDVISSQPVTLHAPGPSVSHHAEKVARDTTQDESSIQKRSIKSISKTKRSEKQVQSDSSSLKSTRDPKPIASMKKLDDRVTAFRSPKESDKCSQVTQVPSGGTVCRYRGYMASTLSRDLKVERTVAERSTYFSRDSPVKRRFITEREDTSNITSPSKLSTGAVPKTPHTVTKSKRVENTIASPEKNVQETKKHLKTSKLTKSTTSPVTTRSVLATEEKVVATLTNARSSTNTAARQKRPVTTDLPSSSSVRQSRLSTTFKKSLPESDVLQEYGGKIKRSEQSKVCGAVKEQRKAPTVCAKGRKLITAVPDTTSKVTVKRRAPELEPRIEMDSEAVKVTDSTEVTKTDGTVVMPVSSSAQILAPAEQDMTTPHSHVTDLKDTAVAHTFSLLSPVPSPESSPSIKSILDKWSAVASERRSSRAPSPSPSASPVRAATSASRSTERVDFSTHTPSSLPSSPSRMVRQTTSQSGVTQILTSEVFTRTVDTSGSIEVIYRQPTSSEAVRRVAVVGGSRSSLHETAPGVGGIGTEGEVSLIDTTDSSLSDSVALPSSSSDHELSMEMRLRNGVSPASPKPTRRSLDLIHDVTGPKLPTSDLMLDYCAVPFVAESEQLALDSSVLRLEGSSATVPLDAVPKTRTCTQVSEERLSPILDVCAVTPPRVKHKFQYEDDEEGEEDEAVAAFLSSPEWTEKSQEKEKHIHATLSEEGAGIAAGDVTHTLRHTTQTGTGVVDGGTVTTATTTTTATIATTITKEQGDVQEHLEKYLDTDKSRKPE